MSEEKKCAICPKPATTTVEVSYSKGKVKKIVHVCEKHANVKRE